MDNCFIPADLLLPDAQNMQRWAVIACDQYTSDMAYWDQVAEFVSDHPSTLNMILPEAHLSKSNQKTIQAIHKTMNQYLSEDILTCYYDSYIYVERTLLNDSVRQGIVGAIDLEKYSFTKDPTAMVLATEKTVLERIPPRMAVRNGAAMEFSHVIVFCNDPMDDIMSYVAGMKDKLTKVYDFDLMQGGGHIAGWLLDGEYTAALQNVLQDYVSSNENAGCYLVADGNHSLATAKSCYEKIKNCMTDEDADSCPARYAMVELENIHSPVISFEPIHRIITHADCQKLLADLQAACDDNGYPFSWVSGTKRGEIRLIVPADQLPLAVFQDFLDEWLMNNSAEIDYIHDDDALISLAQQENTIGFLMPVIDKNDMFSYVASGKTLPRKAFSLGHADEKRYYLEGRKIL